LGKIWVVLLERRMSRQLTRPRCISLDASTSDAAPREFKKHQKNTAATLLSQLLPVAATPFLNPN